MNDRLLPRHGIGAWKGLVGAAGCLLVLGLGACGSGDESSDGTGGASGSGGAGGKSAGGTGGVGGNGGSGNASGNGGSGGASGNGGSSGANGSSGASGSGAGGDAGASGSGAGGAGGTGGTGGDECGGCDSGQECVFQVGGPGSSRWLCAEVVTCPQPCACVAEEQGACTFVPREDMPGYCSCDNGLD